MGSALLIIFNLFLLEAVLSIDNASVLALMVKDLRKSDQAKALRYGLLGAFTFRGLSLFCVSFLIKILWLKLFGGLYLLYLVYGHFTARKHEIEEGVDKQTNKLYLWIRNRVGELWATVILVEMMDMAFSIDNIFAASAMTDKVPLILMGVFAGMVTMRFIAQIFCSLLVRFPSLERSAFIVIGLLGVKLIFVSAVSFPPAFDAVNGFVGSRIFDLSFSGVMLVVFFFPLLPNYKKEVHVGQETR